MHDPEPQTAAGKVHLAFTMSLDGFVARPGHATLADGDLAAEVDRLVALGATRLGSAGVGAVELADPDGNEF